MNSTTCRDPSSLGISPALRPGQAPITPFWMAVEPRLCLSNRAGLTPQTLPTLSQEAMRAKAAPTLRGMQGSGELPPACRGADCSVAQFLQSVSGHFEVVQRPRQWQDGQRMQGKHVVVLLPTREEPALSQVNQLLDHHGDFSRKSGMVQMTESARVWLGNRRGVVQAKENGQLVAHPAPGGLSLTVVAGAQTAQFRSAALPFDGLVLEPVAPVQGTPKSKAVVGPSAAAVQQALLARCASVLEWTDLNGQPIAGDTSLSGKLVLAAVASEDMLKAAVSAHQLAGSIRDVSPQATPVVLFSFLGMLRPQAEGCKSQDIKDDFWQPWFELATQVTKMRNELLNFIHRNAPGEGIELEVLEQWPAAEFVEIMQRRMASVADPTVRRGGQKLLSAYEQARRQMEDLSAKRLNYLLQTIAIQIPTTGMGGAGVAMLAGLPELVQKCRDVIRNSPVLVKALGEKVVVANVSGAADGAPYR